MKDMNILMSCNSKIIKYVPVLMNSLYSNHEKDIKINIYLMYSDISSEHIELVKKYAEDNGQSFFPIHVDNEVFNFFAKVDSKRIDLFPVEAYYHFLAADYMPESVERCMYMDIDMICDNSIYEWYSQKINYYFVSSSLYKKDDYFCFNSGIFLMNIKKLRDDKIDRLFFLGKVNALEGKELYGDQELIGYAFKDFENNGFENKYELGINFRPVWQREYMQDLKVLPPLKVIHYASSNKAWRYYLDESFLHSYTGKRLRHQQTHFDFSFVSCNLLHLIKLFWSYARKTPFYDEIYATALGATNELKKTIPFYVKLNRYEMLNKALCDCKKETEIDIFALPTYNEYVFDLKCNKTKKKSFVELKTVFYIKNQWIIFPLHFETNKDQEIEVEIKCDYKTNSDIYLFLSTLHGVTQHFPKIETMEYCKRLKINANGEKQGGGGYKFICLSSDSFKDRGDFIRFYRFVVRNISDK